MDNATVSDTPQQAPLCSYTCDSCSRGIPSHEQRYNCQDCQGFDYCETCFVDATLIHPGHSFAKMDPTEPRPNHGPQTEDDCSATAKAEELCRSCSVVSQVLPCIHLLLNDKRCQGVGKLCILWPLRISLLIEAAQRGCAFCSFMLYTFFRPFNGEAHMYDEETPWYVRPRENHDDRKALVEHCMDILTRLKTDHFIFNVLPICSRKGAKPPDYDKIEIYLSDKTYEIQDPDEVKNARVFHSAGVITAEYHVYASKGE